MKEEEEEDEKIKMKSALVHQEFHDDIKEFTLRRWQKRKKSGRRKKLNGFSHRIMGSRQGELTTKLEKKGDEMQCILS